MSKSKTITRTDMIKKWWIAAQDAQMERCVEVEAACIVAAATEWAAYVRNKRAVLVEDEHFSY